MFCVPDADGELEQLCRLFGLERIDQIIDRKEVKPENLKIVFEQMKYDRWDSDYLVFPNGGELKTFSSSAVLQTNFHQLVLRVELTNPLIKQYKIFGTYTNPLVQKDKLEIISEDKLKVSYGKELQNHYSLTENHLLIASFSDWIKSWEIVLNLKGVGLGKSVLPIIEAYKVQRN